MTVHKQTSTWVYQVHCASIGDVISKVKVIKFQKIKKNFYFSFIILRFKHLSLQNLPIVIYVKNTQTNKRKDREKNKTKKKKKKTAIRTLERTPLHLYPWRDCGYLLRGSSATVGRTSLGGVDGTILSSAREKKKKSCFCLLPSPCATWLSERKKNSVM